MIIRGILSTQHKFLDLLQILRDRAYYANIGDANIFGLKSL